MRRPPIVLYDSWRGRYTDSPRAIFEELVRRRRPLRHVWVIAPGQDAPAGTTVVRPHSARHLAALARARYVVVNDLLPLYYVKPPGATVVQTWHGSPLKRIGFDVVDPTYPHPRRYAWHLRRNAHLWTHLISQNPFSTEIFRDAFRFTGPVLETGYPRNDSLLAETPAGGGRRVLFAPTWRDAAHGDTGRRAADLVEQVRGLAAGIGGASLLLRLHKHEADALASAALPANVTDVSKHGHINDLLAEADLLVTDYSSVMFDFAVTGRPIVLFVPDLVNYREIERGLYLDPVDDAPGPVAETIDDAVAAIRAQLAGDVDRGRYDAFRARFCPWDDGQAAARVVDEIFR